MGRWRRRLKHSFRKRKVRCFRWVFLKVFLYLTHKVVETNNDRSTDKCSATSVSITNPWRLPYKRMPSVTVRI